MWWSRLKIFCLLLVALLISACGFHLQGFQGFPEEMQVTYIDTHDRYSDFYRLMQETLQSAGMEVTTNRSAATAILQIREDRSGQELLTVSRENVPLEYIVFYKLQYALIVDGRQMIEPQLLSLNRDYTYDETDVLGKQREQSNIREALARDLVRQVSRTLAAAGSHGPQSP